jgi:hypothetical protein
LFFVIYAFEINFFKKFNFMIYPSKRFIHPKDLSIQKIYPSKRFIHPKDLSKDNQKYNKDICTPISNEINC